MLSELSQKGKQNEKKKNLCPARWQQRSVPLAELSRVASR